ncbi:MAG: methyltransferase domain-containing protein [Rhodospirillales bacterium]|nr:methyltransferase domain-containing protein [Rhodospirillales bacterium]
MLANVAETPTAHADPDVVAGHVRSLIDQGRLAAARPLLAALPHLGCARDSCIELEARFLVREGRAAEAVLVLDDGIAAYPDGAALHLCRGDARAQGGDMAGAARDAADAIILDPGNVKAKAMLGAVLIELDRPAEARICLAAAVAQNPGVAAYGLALAQAEERIGDVRAAADVLHAAIAVNPYDSRLQIALITLQMRQQDFARAAELAVRAIRGGGADACVFGLHGHALSILGRHADAGRSYAEALKLAPEDRYVRHLVQAAGLLPATEAAPPEYVETVFDGIAEGFNAHLVELGYRIPGLLRTALLRHVPDDDRSIGPTLDLGCGTGMAAVALSDRRFEELVGVDLSERMLCQAAATGLYHRLVKGELREALTERSAYWTFVIAADVLCYFGSLEEIFASAHTALREGGMFIFSVEEWEAGQNGDKWSLSRLARYQHKLPYVSRAAEAAGFSIATLQPDILRNEDGQPVRGAIVALRRS